MAAFQDANPNALDIQIGRSKHHENQPKFERMSLCLDHKAAVFVRGQNGLHADGLMCANRGLKPSLYPHDRFEICLLQGKAFDISNPRSQQVWIDDPDRWSNASISELP